MVLLSLLQVPTEPLWTRDQDESVSISLLPGEDTASGGKSGLFGGTVVKINSIPSPSSRKTEKGNITKKPADEKNDIDEDDGKPVAKSALEEYQSLVGNAKLDMIKHLLFDKEKELSEKMEEKEKKETERGVDATKTEDIVSEAENQMDKKENFPVILERNLEHELSRLEIREEMSDTGIATTVGEGFQNDAITAQGDTNDLSTDPFMDHMKIERSICDRLSVSKVRSEERAVVSHEETLTSTLQEKQSIAGRNVTFCDNVSDDHGEISNLRNSPDAVDTTLLNNPSNLSHSLAESTDHTAKPPKKQPPVHPLDPIWHVFRAWTTRLTVLHLWSHRLDLGDQLEKQKLEEKVEHIVSRVERDEKK